MRVYSYFFFLHFLCHPHFSWFSPFLSGGTESALTATAASAHEWMGCKLLGRKEKVTETEKGLRRVVGGEMWPYRHLTLLFLSLNLLQWTTNTNISYFLARTPLDSIQSVQLRNNTSPIPIRYWFYAAFFLSEWKLSMGEENKYRRPNYFEAQGHNFIKEQWNQAGGHPRHLYVRRKMKGMRYVRMYSWSIPLSFL